MTSRKRKSSFLLSSPRFTLMFTHIWATYKHDFADFPAQTDTHHLHKRKHTGLVFQKPPPSTKRLRLGFGQNKGGCWTSCMWRWMCDTGTWNSGVMDPFIDTGTCKQADIAIVCRQMKWTCQHWFSSFYHLSTHRAHWSHKTSLFLITEIVLIIRA